MQPTQAQSNPAPLDPQVVSLAQAIRQTESGGNFSAQGKSGEQGGYQWMPDTWSQHAKQVLGDANAPMTPANQNAVAYTVIKQWKDQGLNPAEIAAKWNSGSSTDWQNKTGTNSQGVDYNVPAYVKQVTDAYQQFKIKNGAVNPAPQTAQLPQAQPDNRDFLQKAGDFINAIFPGKQIGQDIGTLAGYIYAQAHDALTGSQYAKYYDTNAPTPLQALGDVAQGALMVGTGMPEGSATSVFGKMVPALAQPEGILGRIGLNTALGAGYGATGAIAGGSTDPGDIAKQTALGAGVGGVAGVIGEGVSKALESMPTRLTRQVLPQLKNEDTINYALDNVKLGSVDTMLENSQQALKSYNSQIDAILAHPEFNPTGDILPTNLMVAGKDITNSVLKDFPNSNYDQEAIFSKLKGQVPAEAATIDKLQNGTITLDEANTLRQKVDRITYKTAIDSPEVRAGKELASSFGNALRTQVQTKAKATAPIFAEYSKEINLFKALKKLADKTEKKSLISMKDLAFAGAGSLFGGAHGALGTAIAERALSNPAVKLGAAKALRAVEPALQGAIQVGQKAATVLPGRINQ